MKPSRRLDLFRNGKLPGRPPSDWNDWFVAVILTLVVIQILLQVWAAL